MYSPVNIYNPASRNHSAILHPGQELRVTFHDVTILDDCKAHIQSDLLELGSELYGNQGKTFVFTPIYDLSRWANVSTVFLGQIYFSGRGKVNPSISLYMESLNDFKKDIVTTVNPDDQVLKMYPHQILEVVAYSPLWGQDLEWNYEQEDSALELLCDIRIDPTVYKMSESIRRLNDAFFTYPRMLQTSSVSYLEYHWWFRWREMSANLAKSFQCPPVRLSFLGSVGGEIRTRHTVQVALNDRAKSGWADSRSYQVTFEDSAMDKGEEDFSIQPFILPTLRTEKSAYQGHPGKKRHHKNRQSRPSVHVVSPKQHRHSYSSYWRHLPAPKKQTPKVFQARDVQVRLKPVGTLDEGCKVVSDDPVVPISHEKVMAALPAPSTSVPPNTLIPPNATGRYPSYAGFRGKSTFNPPKAAYYYDGPSEQWD